MKYYSWENVCLCTEQTTLPKDACQIDKPFTPLVILVNTNPMDTRGFYAISSTSQLLEKEGPECLCVSTSNREIPVEMKEIIEASGATVLNVAFKGVLDYYKAWRQRKTQGLKVTLVGLGDVGGTVLTGLKLLGKEIGEIAVYDPYEPMGYRYELEMNQVLSIEDDYPMPMVTIANEDTLFDCDVFIFTASKGVPPVGSKVQDVRMAQFEANKTMIDAYAKKAREGHFKGLFCQVSDPVDHLAREMFLASNRDEHGEYDFEGLIPEQIQGFGLGVMSARAMYYARKHRLDERKVRAYGPHGQGLIVANASTTEDYNEEISLSLEKETKEANLRVRDLGFKPYIAPGLSSAAISILRMLRNETHHGAIPLGGTYFGCKNRWTENGIEICREEICPALMSRIRETYVTLKEFPF